MRDCWNKKVTGHIKRRLQAGNGNNNDIHPTAVVLRPCVQSTTRGEEPSSPGLPCFDLKKGKDMFLYSAVSSLLDRSKRFTLHTLWQTCSFRHQLDFSGKHFSHNKITHIFTAVYSQISYLFIQLSELGHR